MLAGVVPVLTRERERQEKKGEGKKKTRERGEVVFSL